MSAPVTDTEAPVPPGADRYTYVSPAGRVVRSRTPMTPDDLHDFDSQVETMAGGPVEGVVEAYRT